MLVGPVFSREVVTAPRRIQWYVSRGTYVAALLLLMCTAWLILAGTQIIHNLGDLARFGAILFQILVPLQLALVIVFSALSAASAVAQEKDRRTLILLLMTNLSNRELVLGKMLASLLNVLGMLAAALPLFMISMLLGGVSLDQIVRVFAVTVAAGLVAGSLGSTLALWREKTFQTLALTALLGVFWLAFWEIVASGGLGLVWVGVPTTTWAICFSPWQAILAAAQPSILSLAQGGWLGTPVHVFLIVATLAAGLINAIAIAMVRAWNPSREVRRQPTGQKGNDQQLEESPQGVASADQRRAAHNAPGKVRVVWDNPILWREIRTWAYGRKVLVIRLGYLFLFAATAVVLHGIVNASPADAELTRSVMSPSAGVLIPFFVLSLVLICALSVTSITTERDSRALDLLLVTDLSPKEFIFGKLGGVFYNTKEMIVLPMLLCLYVWLAGRGPGANLFLSGENLSYLLIGLLVISGFAAMLGIHGGLTYSNSRSAIGVSLGTLLFLFLGVATCMRMMIAFSGSFQGQLQPFLAFMLGGGVGLYLALGSRNPSTAIGIASFGAPIATFYALTSFLLGNPLAVFFVTVVTYSFATAAMLIPALYEFDVATGRTTSGDE